MARIAYASHGAAASVYERAVDWRVLDDPDNPQNHNAGNGGDLVKHTVYLTLLETLLGREPWRTRTSVHECHAGRGIYRSKHGALIARLLETDLALSQAERDILHELRAEEGFYAGSALLVAHSLGRGAHAYQGLEWDPATRRILHASLSSLAVRPREIEAPHAQEAMHFDGESHVAAELPKYGRNHVVLLDPFALWHHEKHAFRRERFRCIVDAWCARPEPPLALFWTWGRALDRARADLEGRTLIENGYASLAARLHTRSRIVVRWTWELSYAMWLLVPEALVRDLCDALALACEQLFVALAPAGAELDVACR